MMIKEMNHLKHCETIGYNTIILKNHGITVFAQNTCQFSR